MAQLAIHGGPKACDVQWPRWPQWGDRERQALFGVLDSGDWWYGDRVRQFEREFAEFQGARFGITCTNGTAALEASLLALGIGAGDEVIVPPLTFLATASAVLRVNAVPIFADVDEGTLNLDPDEAERKITPRTKAIIPVHFAGYVADMDRFLEIGQRRGVAILEDACHSWGSQWKGKGTGAIGACGAFSFQASKNITSGEGGIVLTDDEALAEQCRSYVNCGRGKDKPWYEHFVLGGNLRMTEFQAALLSAQITRLEEQTLRRMANADRLTLGLRSMPGVVTLRDEPRMTRRAYHLYPLRIDEARLGVTARQFRAAVAAEGVIAHEAYPHPLYKNPLFLNRGAGPSFCPVSCPYYGEPVDYSAVQCPVTERVLADMFWLWHTVLLGTERDTDMVLGAFDKVLCNLDEVRSIDA